MLILQSTYRKTVQILAIAAGLLSGRLCTEADAAEPLKSWVSGSMALKYDQYDAKWNELDPKDGSVVSRQNLNANSFSQQYSLMYNLTGTTRDARFGRYELRLGYNWKSFDTKVTTTDKESSISQRDGQIVFKGDALFDPPAIPLRLKIFSEDAGGSLREHGD